MRPKIITSDTYQGYRLYQDPKGIKSSDGFLESSLQSILRIGQYALQHFESPKAFHLTLEAPDQNTLKLIPLVLKRWVEAMEPHRSEGDVPKVLYVSAREFRKGKHVYHVHLHVVFDSAITVDPLDEVYELKRKLKATTKADSVVLHKRKLPQIKVIQSIDPETGEVLRSFSTCAKTLFHNLQTEYEDWVQRCSYIAKLYSKSGVDRYSFTSSNTKLRSAHQQAKETSQSLLNRLQAVASTRSTVDIYKVTGRLYSPFNHSSGTCVPPTRLTTMSDKRCSKTNQSLSEQSAWI